MTFNNDLKASLVGKEVEVMVLYGDHAVDRYREAVSDIRSKYAKNNKTNLWRTLSGLVLYIKSIKNISQKYSLYNKKI